MVVGVIVGFIIGIVVVLFGVVGGELLILMFVLLFGVDIKFVGSLLFVVSLLIMLVGFICYSCD